MDLAHLVGMSFSIDTRVQPSDTATVLGSGGIASLATPILIAWMEQAARDAVQPALPAGHTTVGSEVHIRHLAPTPVGGSVQVTASVVSIDRRRITFRLSARDEAGLIGEGTHERFVVDCARFMERLATRFEETGS